MSLPTEIEPRQNVYQRLLDALRLKTPLPPPEWDLVKLDEEILRATREYNPDSTARFVDAMTTAIYYLTDFSSRMPAWIDVSVNNDRVVAMCQELAAEIEGITFRPDKIIHERGKLKSWLKAILAVQTCLIYREETERVIARDKAAKLAGEAKPNSSLSNAAEPSKQMRQTGIAAVIWKKAQTAVARDKPTISKTVQKTSEQPSLF